jgi:tetratricopeptide (TPR) repeat protein
LGRALLLSALLASNACEHDAGPRQMAAHAPPASSSAEQIVLAPHAGDHSLDERIRELQRRIPTSKIPAQELERLGWTFIARARELADPGSYNLALQCALAIEQRDASSHAALLLRGHALHSLHHFAEAERIARKLVEARGLPFDHGLLGDVLVDRGQLDEASTAYQRMVDLRPDMHSYSRAAHVRYLTGDLPGALEAMAMASRAASPRNREGFAWTWAKLAQYQLQSGAPELAQSSAERALEVAPDSPQALKVSAQIRLARSELEPALDALRKAIERSPHPELLWMSVEALRGLDRTEQAHELEVTLLASGESEDPRAFALYLATIGRDLPLAERLVQAEWAERKDCYGYEALAWVQSARGRHAEALRNAERSIATRSEDPRLYYHAGLIAERAGDPDRARDWLAHAASGASLLLPSQRAQLTARQFAL